MLDNASAKSTLGKTISHFRKQHSMTQAQLAEKMNVTDKAVSKWERDISCPDINTLPRLAELFGITVDQLMQSKDFSPVAAKNIHDILNLIFQAVTVAMGVAVTVLSVLKQIDLYSGFTLLGIGLACAGISLLRRHK